MLSVLLLSSCGYSEQELDNAYREGHRAGIIWCKRLGTPMVPNLDEPLLARWRDGWRESTSIQCPKDATDVTLAVHPAS